MTEDIFEKLRQFCAKGYVTRQELKRITGGLICGNTMAKLDRLGNGIKNRKIIGKKTIYYIDDLITWLKEHTEIIEK